MFRGIDVWKRLDDGTLARYRCLQKLPQNRYCVQSVDFYRQPLDEKQMSELDRQFIELLLDQAPDDENEMYETLEEAISKHDQDFQGLEEEVARRMR
jgi:predicted class III extradiol MEMO1 family dioxygenase